MRYTLFVSILIVVLGSISTLMLASVAQSEAIGQTLYVGIGFVAFWAIQLSTPQAIKRLAPTAFVLVFLGLILTLLIGRVSKGSMRWLTIGPVHLQLSEIAKPVVALGLAWIADRYGIQSQRMLIASLTAVALLAFPVFTQPDLGSAMIITMTGLAAIYFAISNIKMLIPWIVAGVIGLAVVWQFFLYDYQRSRITSFLSPQETQSGASYNARQALIAVGSGKLTGRGFGHGVQSNLKFLPEHHTDFFFASYAEELGFLGVLFLITLYGSGFIILTRGAQNLEPFAHIYILAFVSGITAQAIIHMGMNMHMFPITGIPLPLLSSGGSSFVSVCIGLGLAMKLQTDRQVRMD